MGNAKRMVNEISEKYNFNSPRVFSAMLKVPREKFTPRKYRYMAYEDNPIPIGYGQTMSQPYTVAFMTDLILELDRPHSARAARGKKVLEIGTGSGYQAAVLSKLAGKVYTIELIESLYKKARKRLKELGYKNVEVKKGSGSKGWKEKSPYDAILITANIEGHLPKELPKQLKSGGIIVTPINGVMTKFTKKGNGLEKKEYGEFSFVPFIKEGGS